MPKPFGYQSFGCQRFKRRKVKRRIQRSTGIIWDVVGHYGRHSQCPDVTELRNYLSSQTLHVCVTTYCVLRALHNACYIVDINTYLVNYLKFEVTYFFSSDVHISISSALVNQFLKCNKQETHGLHNIATLFRMSNEQCLSCQFAWEFFLELLGYIFDLTGASFCLVFSISNSDKIVLALQHICAAFCCFHVIKVVMSDPTVSLVLLQAALKTAIV